MKQAVIHSRHRHFLKSTATPLKQNSPATGPKSDCRAVLFPEIQRHHCRDETSAGSETKVVTERGESLSVTGIGARSSPSTKDTHRFSVTGFSVPVGQFCAVYRHILQDKILHTIGLNVGILVRLQVKILESEV